MTAATGPQSVLGRSQALSDHMTFSRANPAAWNTHLCSFYIESSFLSTRFCFKYQLLGKTAHLSWQKIKKKKNKAFLYSLILFLDSFLSSLLALMRAVITCSLVYLVFIFFPFKDHLNDGGVHSAVFFQFLSRLFSIFSKYYWMQTCISKLNI